MKRVSVVVETDSVGEVGVTFEDCVAALAAQTYPRELIEVIVAEGGKIPQADSVVRRAFPDAIVLRLPGGSKFQLKNLGMDHATGDITAFVDGDCAPAPDWLSRIVELLGSAPAEVAGVQGVTILSPGFLAAELSALLYGIRTDANGAYSTRLVTDNCAFRRAAVQGLRFEHAEYSTVSDTLFFRRLTRAGLRMLVCDGMRMNHSFPGLSWDGIIWFLHRAYGTGYYMVETRRQEPELRGAALVRWGGIGWPVLSAGKVLVDLRQVFRNRRRLNLRLWRVLPALATFEISLFVGGMAAVLRRPFPRWS
jgi:glycosyltransferase involved in cell wall biosynthesis